MVKVFFVSTTNDTFKETEKVTEASAQGEVLPTTSRQELTCWSPWPWYVTYYLWTKW